MSSSGTLQKNVLTRLREESATKEQSPSKEEIEALSRKPDFFQKMIETFEKLWANKHSKIGKIVRKEID